MCFENVCNAKMHLSILILLNGWKQNEYPCFCFFVGVTFNSVHFDRENYYQQDIGGTIFAFNHQDIRIWAMSGENFSLM